MQRTFMSGHASSSNFGSESAKLSRTFSKVIWSGFCAMSLNEGLEAAASIADEASARTASENFILWGESIERWVWREDEEVNGTHGDSWLTVSALRGAEAVRGFWQIFRHSSEGQVWG